jgi:dTDP-glucose pyrophosphorylase
MLIASAVDGVIGLYPVDGDRWSFAKVKNGLVSEVAEKNRISNYGLVGLHYWKRGSDFVRYATRMIEARDTVNNEYYIAPTYQYAIKDGKRIAPFIVDEFWEMGTPESLQRYKDMVE